MSSAQMLTGPETHSGVMWKMRAAISSTLSRDSQTGEANRLLRGVAPGKVLQGRPGNRAPDEFALGLNRKLDAVPIPPWLRNKRLFP